ncbi:MAG: glycosyltransferase family 2 protein [Alphaproteobacteria bacterium]|nr:glycosyltransferase family 2 protein [Alphaproteobacteria bacterium]MBU0792988.1 glycosyltransferase family 2 protein [Alphaproteobacteria bacterium]MBU0875146.1 glycosyltransferase family 2 protein [Alphaproteobacteria bacterium]MBU1768895.1 glycosyltransferase family 2 protein [Alphaproteobacteria bacterium]
MTDVSVVIVNYGTADLVIEGVASILAAHQGGRSVDVHVVDNGSPGDDAERLSAAAAELGWGDRVRLYLERENHGFGRGNNVVLHALSASGVPPRYVFLLNPDARLGNEAVDILASFLDDHADAIAAGPALLRPDGAAVSAAFRFPDAGSEFVGTAANKVVSRMFPRKAVALPPETGQQPVDWITGAAFMVRFAALEQVGFFDPDFFLYFEETELMWRLNRSGRAVWHVPEAHVVHIAGAATGMKGGQHVRRIKPGYWYDSWRLYHVKTRGTGAARLAAMLHVAGSTINLGFNGLRGKPSSVPDRFFPDFWRHVLQPLFLGDPLLARPDGQNVKARSA